MYIYNVDISTMKTFDIEFLILTSATMCKPPIIKQNATIERDSSRNAMRFHRITHTKLNFNFPRIPFWYPEGLGAQMWRRRRKVSAKTNEVGWVTMHDVACRKYRIARGCYECHVTVSWEDRYGIVLMTKWSWDIDVTDECNEVCAKLTLKIIHINMPMLRSQSNIHI